MSFNLILIVFVVCCFSFIIFQIYEFVQNYDYIQNFNNKYKKYEFSATPSYNYVDKSYYDPNDSETNINKKWTCKLYGGSWYAVSKDYGLVIENGIYKSWSTELECINYIFSDFYLNYNNPCNISTNNSYCNIFNSLNNE